MAIWTPSPIIGEIRKKAGSDVFSKNHYGPIIRKHIKPINPKSAGQTTQRNSLKTLAQGWKAIGQAKILAWNALAAGIALKNRLGNGITLTGESMYLRNNLNILSVGGTAISTAPSVSSNVVPRLLGVVITIAAGVVSMAYTPGAVATNYVEVRASGSVSPGKTYNSKFKSFGKFASNAASPYVATTDYTAVFGTPPAAGGCVFFEWRVVDSLTGFCTGYERARVIAT
jgi:hypothetical protein